ncbi:glycosyltransferase family 4 protein [Pseudoclavibacter terrae]|uniref:glycosyltransferase family 4 protein n=1 Tax=Pseudoclavibacter terrae TaxID=1530195 RepID=UPI00142EAD23|nr:glycosyltransferase family 4 protein [Pseudoclavibacter terrae]
MSHHLRIGFLTPWDTSNANAWSGVLGPMMLALAQRATLIPLSTADVQTALPDRVLARLLGSISSKKYLWDQAIATSRARGRNASSVVGAADLDVILAVAASQDVAFLNTRGIPIVQVGDATFKAIRDYYPMFTNLHPLSVVQQEAVAKRATRATDRFAMATQWSIDSLVADYGVSSGSCVLAPFGPALEPSQPPTAALGEAGVLRALLVTSDWARKGGDLAVRVIEHVRRQHPGVTLTVVGNTPDGLPDWVENLGRLPRQELAEQYERADVLLELATANAGGVTLTDAAAFGLPAIATDTGGVSSIVESGTSGLLFPAGADTFTAAVAAVETMLDRDVRSRYARGARAQHEATLNWEAWADAVTALCVEAVSSAPHRGEMGTRA